MLAGLSGDAYSWYKILHLISVFSWMAGLFYLPRLYVYHTKAAPGSEMSEMFKVMERRLLRAIMYPAMVSSWLFGGLMYLELADYESPWLWVKLVAAVGLTGMNVFLARWRLDFAADRNTRPEVFYRVINEVPTLFMVIIIIFVVLKPV